MSVNYQERPSPNYNARPLNAIPSLILLHADASPTASGSLAWLRDPASKVSYHVLIGRLGDVYRLVQYEHRAWHAGVSKYRDRGNVNDYSIGVSFSNKNDGQEPYRPEQLQAGLDVCEDIMRHWPAITIDRVTTHALVAVPPGRKDDPRSFPLADFLYDLRLRVERP